MEDRPSFRDRASRLYHYLFGPEPRVIWLLVAPLLVGIAMDLVLRPRSLRDFPPKELFNYFGSSLVSAGFFGGSLWAMAKLYAGRNGRFGALKKVAIGLYFLLFLLPFTFFAYGGQLFYYRVFHSYISRDTIRLGMELRGTFGAWLSAWWSKLVPGAIFAVLFTTFLGWGVRRASEPLKLASPIVPAVSFLTVCICLWMDFVETRGLQAAPPDACFLHSIEGLIHDKIRPPKEVKGMSIRVPGALPPIPAPAKRPNVILVITESVRADSTCSETSDTCKSQFYDDVIPERVGLLKMTTQASGTFTACMVLWTGLAPDATFTTAHTAAVLWEVAKATGYKTGYFGAQNLRYRDLGAFLENSSIDTLVSAADIGFTHDPHVGAPDELAAARLLDWVKAQQNEPYFAVLHLSNTHWPYRVDPNLQPFEPHDENPFHEIAKLKNHYRNSVLMQERTMAGLFRDLKTLPSWKSTIGFFVSDHGEQFREHGGLYHLNNLFDEEVRIPGYVVFGDDVLDDAQTKSLRSYRTRRVYGQDINATIVDLLGGWDARPRFPLAEQLTGRSLLHRSWSEPIETMSTTSGVWEDIDPVYGVEQGERKLVGTEQRPWTCYDLHKDPGEHSSVPIAQCGIMLPAAQKRFPFIKSP